MYYALQGAENVALVQSTIVSAAEASFELARELRRVGNLSELNLAKQQDLYEQARLDLAHAQGDVYELRERLNRLMGLFGADTAWTVPQTIADIPDAEPPLEHLETIAVKNRLDLAAGRTEIEVLAEAVAVTRNFRWIGRATVGMSAAERPEVNSFVFGPTISLQLPIFDQGQARIARAEAVLHHAQWRLAELAVAIRAEVRALRYRMLLARDVQRHYRDVLVPLRRRIVELSQREYNFMLLGSFELLEARRREAETYREYVRATRDYWVARTELERILGARLSAKPRDDGADPRKSPPSEEHKHDQPK